MDLWMGGWPWVCTWMDGCIGGRIDGRMDGWMDGLDYIGYLEHWFGKDQISFLLLFLKKMCLMFDLI